MSGILADLNILSFFVAPIFYKLLFMSFSAIVISLVIMLIRKIFDKQISPFWKYAMWSLVLVALIIPYRPTANVAVMKDSESIENISFREEYDKAKLEAKMASLSEDNIIKNDGSKIEITQNKAADLVKKEEQIYLKSLVFDVIIPIVWFFGAVMIAIYLLISKFYFLKGTCSRDKYDLTRFNDVLNRCKIKFKVASDIDICVTENISSPAITGIFKPTILLPTYAYNMSDESLFYVISHELGHYKRNDLIFNYILLLVNLIYWFNPFLWVVFKLVRDDMEVLNDEYVINTIGDENSKNYSKSLVEVLAFANGISIMPKLLCMVDGKKNIERRINMIKLGEKFRRRKFIIAISSVLLIIVIATLFLTSGKQKHSIGIYAMEGLAKEMKDYEQFIKNNEPIITEKDIVAYNKEMRMFFLSDEVLKRYEKKRNYLKESIQYGAGGSLILGADGTSSFVITVDDEIIYDGMLQRPLAFSYIPPGAYMKDCKEGLRVYNALGSREDLQLDDEKLVSAFEDMGMITDDIFEVRSSASSGTYDVKKLFKNRTKYIGDNTKVINIVSSIPYPDGATYDSISLNTSEQPYSMEIKLNVDSGIDEVEFYRTRLAAFRSRVYLLFSLIENLERVDFVLNDRKDIKATCFVNSNSSYFSSEDWKKIAPEKYQLSQQEFDRTGSLEDLYNYIEFYSDTYIGTDDEYEDVSDTGDNEPITVVIKDDIDYSKIDKNRSAYIDENGIFFDTSGQERRELSTDEIADFNIAFQVLLDGKEKNEQVLNPICHMFSSSYSKIEDINIKDLVYYMPRDILSSKNKGDVEQFEALRKLPNSVYKKVEKIEDWPTPIGAIPADRVNHVLNKFANISLDKLNGKEIEYAFYVDKYDSFYSFASDFGAGNFVAESGEIDNDMIILDGKNYDNNATLILVKKGKYFYIVSHVIEPKKEEMTVQTIEEIRRKNDRIVGEKLEEIISSPLTSSNPKDYIEEHRRAYEEILKMDEIAFDYMMREFKDGEGTGIRGHIMAIACRDILGSKEEGYDGFDWYKKYGAKDEIKLPDFEYKGDDENLKLVYDAYIKPQYFEDGSFMVLTPHILKVVKEDDMTKIFARIIDHRYKLYGELLTNTGGEAASLAFTFKDNNVVKVEMFDPKKINDIDGRISVTMAELCKTPVTGKSIKGLEEQFKDVPYDDIKEKAYTNLTAHLKENGIEKARLYSAIDEIEFKMDK